MTKVKTGDITKYNNEYYKANAENFLANRQKRYIQMNQDTLYNKLLVQIDKLNEDKLEELKKYLLKKN